MLVLSRKPGQRIFVGENQEVSITVLKMRGSTVWVGIGAEDGVPIHREEVYYRIMQERAGSEEGDEPSKMDMDDCLDGYR